MYSLSIFHIQFVKFLDLGLLINLFFSTAVAAPETRLAGGDPTTINDFPYIVAYTYSYPNAGITIQRCVGSLISSWHVLSSAFCFRYI